MIPVPFKCQALILSMVLAVSWSNITWGTEIRIPPIEVRSGQTVEIPIMIDKVDNLAGVKLIMKYTPGILVFKKAVKTEHTKSLMHIVNNRKPGILIVVMAGSKGITGKDISILKLIFETKKGLTKNHSTQVTIEETQLMDDRLKIVKNRVAINPITIVP